MRLSNNEVFGVILLLIVCSCSPIKIWEEKGPQIVFSEHIHDSLEVQEQTYGTDLARCILVNFYCDPETDIFFEGSSKRDKAISSFRREMMDHIKTEATAYFATTVVAGKPIFKSDVSLFGEIPGSDLSDYIFVPNSEDNYCSVLLSYPDLTPSYDAGIVKPSSVEEVFFVGRMLSSSRIAFKEGPTTGEASAVLTVEIPVEDILFLNAFDEDGNFDESKVTTRTRTLKRSITVKF